MMIEWGHFALILGLCVASWQVILAVLGYCSHRADYLLRSQRAVYLQCILVAISFFTLAYALVTNDFSVVYVANNSNTHLPMIYRFCALWGAHEGSLLLWLMILSLWSVAVAWRGRGLPLEVQTLVLAVLAVIAMGFYLFLLLTSNPFIRYLPRHPIEGADLNPILQDPGLAMHPPMLYLGYVGFAVSFAFAITLLITGRVQSDWVRWVRPWALASWSCLTVGIVMGSWWAYRELGWGGWWFWDPVENASLMPWLAGTALLHSLIVNEQRHTFYGWTILLAILAFALSLLGTFLVRSGVLISVHSFAADPQRGFYLLLFLFTIVGSALALYAWRARYIVNKIDFSLSSRETFLLGNNVLLLTAMLTVLLGTLYPLIIQALHAGELSVGSPYFNAVCVPLMLLLLALMAVAPSMNWREQAVKPVLRRLWLGSVMVLVMTGILFKLNHEPIVLWPFIGFVLAGWLLFHTLSLLWRQPIRNLTVSRWAMIIAHMGVAVTAMGIVMTSYYSQTRDVSMQLGDRLTVGAYAFELQAIQQQTGIHYQTIRATVQVMQSQHHRLVARLYPELRTYLTQQITTSHSAISANLWRDIYVALAAPLPGNAWAFRLYVKPGVRWIWAGGILMAIGGILSIWGSYYRRRYSVKRDVIQIN